MSISFRYRISIKTENIKLAVGTPLSKLFNLLSTEIRVSTSTDSP